ncbi:MAG: FtsQ-type POTRA domain-containing protein [Clostridia bacterium]|nr:FtsQ-type POTRA domain-containing protein [Clostridia bacterium]
MDHNEEKRTVERSRKDRAKIFSAKSSRNRMRIISRIAYFVVVFLILLLVLFLIGKLFFSVDTFIVNGSEVYTRNEIVEKCGYDKGDLIFFVSEKEIRENIKKEFPFVDNVTIEKQLPGTVIINLTDEQESFYFKYDDKFYVVSAGLKVLAEMDNEEKIRDRYGKIVPMEIDGKNIKQISLTKELVFFDPEAFRRHEKILSLVCNTWIYEKLTSLDVSDIYDVSLVYDGRIEIYFGKHMDLAKKLASAKSVIDGHSEKAKGSIYIYDPGKAHVSLKDS